ncbi:MAG: MobF family relaxase, partial [Acidimicrobiales bacterium]
MINISPCFDPDYPFKEVTRDASDYYLRKGEAPGFWTGDGARALGLAGEVSPAALRALFCGKHPSTGEYLATARGSSARAAVRSGERHLDVAAAAARLDRPAAAVRAMLRAGELAGERRIGGWRVSDSAIDAYREGRPQPPALGRLPVPAEDGTYALADAARIAGVHRSYLSRLLAKGKPEATVGDDGRLVQYLIGTRDEAKHWRVSVDELDRFMAGRVTARVVPAYDVAIRPPKSVSILHALGGLIPADELAAHGLPADVPAEVMAAHHAAVGEAVAALERHAGWIRGPGGRVQATGLVIAAFDHRSSRMGDPLLHTHLVVANVARGVDGRMAALDGTALYAWAKAIGHLYQARLRLELTTRLGVVFDQPHNGTADMVGIPRAVIECFSQRRHQRDALLARLGRSGARAAQAAVLASRPAKGTHPHQSPEELAARAAEVGFRPCDLV